MLKADSLSAVPHDVVDADIVHHAVASIASAAWMQNRAPDGDVSLSANERTSISALIAYVAHYSGEHEFRVERRLSDRFNIPNVSCLPSSEFDSAIRYLVDGMEIVC